MKEKWDIAVEKDEDNSDDAAYHLGSIQEKEGPDALCIKTRPWTLCKLRILMCKKPY